MQSQTDKLWELLKDGKAYRTDFILSEIYGNEHLGLSRIGARIFDIKQKYGVKIKGWKDEQTPSLYWYQMEKDWRKELVKACVRQGCKTANEILKHITCRTGIIYEKPEDIDQDGAKWLLSEFEIDKPCCST